MVDPIYRQIADDLRRQIETGDLAKGDQLKTELELQEEYGASRNTIRDAIKWLITRRLVETRPGQGMFVPEAIDPFVTPLSALPGDIEKVFGVEGAAYASEVRASLRSPKSPSRESRSSRPARGWPPSCSFRRARMSSAGTSAGPSTAGSGRCRPPSTRCGWSSRVP